MPMCGGKGDRSPVAFVVVWNKEWNLQPLALRQKLRTKFTLLPVRFLCVHFSFFLENLWRNLMHISRSSFNGKNVNPTQDSAEKGRGEKHHTAWDCYIFCTE